MAVPTTVADLDLVAANNSPAGSDAVGTIDDYIRAHASIIKQVSNDSVTDADVTTAITTERTAVATLTNKTLTSPALGTPASGNLANCTFPTLNQNTTGTASNLSGTPALPNGTTATTQTAGDNSTKIATTAFVSAATSAISVRAACVFDGTLSGTNAPISGTALNVSTVTRVSTGVYEINFTSAFSDNNYIVVSNADPAYSAIICGVLYSGCTASKATIKTYTATPAAGDNGRVTFVLYKI